VQRKREKKSRSEKVYGIKEYMMKGKRERGRERERERERERGEGRRFLLIELRATYVY